MDRDQQPARRFRVGIGTTRVISLPRRYTVPHDWSNCPDELGPQEVIPGSEETIARYEARVAAGHQPQHPGDTFADWSKVATVAEAVCEYEWEDDE